MPTIASPLGSTWIIASRGVKHEDNTTALLQLLGWAYLLFGPRCKRSPSDPSNYEGIVEERGLGYKDGCSHPHQQGDEDHGTTVDPCYQVCVHI
jgi:hypothetical protein